MRKHNFIKSIQIIYKSLPAKVRITALLIIFVLLSIPILALMDKPAEPYQVAYQTNTGSEGNGTGSEDSNNDKKPKIKEVVIVIDPGHGGDDLGATYGSVEEKKLNLDISKRLGKLLEDAGIKIVYTRETDVFIDLSPRVDIANNLDATLFISVHNNYMPDNSNYKGTETLYCPPADGVERKMDGKKLATIIQQELVKTLKTVDNGIIYRPNLAVIRKTNMPAVIAEIAYISNDSDRTKLSNAEFRQKSAQALSNAVLKALEKMEAYKDENGVWKVVQ